MEGFDRDRTIEDVTAWIRDFFAQNGPGCKAVLGISGGKDSTVTGAILVRALGKERVFGVLMPQGQQKDLDMAILAARTLEIAYTCIDIGPCVEELTGKIAAHLAVPLSRQTKLNLPPRVRMATLYAVSQSMNGRVANTSNLSEAWVGYSTRYGDGAGDFSPLSCLTVGEVKEIGRALGLLPCLIDKPPADGLTGTTDEANLGFSYAVLDAYIRTGVCKDQKIKARIDDLHRKNKFKRELMPAFPYAGPIRAQAE